MALPSLDAVPMKYMIDSEDDKPVMVPFTIQLWLSTLIDTMNEALLEIDKRLTAGGL